MEQVIALCKHLVKSSEQNFTMGNRWLNTLIVVFWLVAMNWLVRTKIFHSLSGSELPSYAPSRLLDQPDEREVGWSIEWNRRHLGTARSRIHIQWDGSSRVVSSIEFHDLPLDILARQLFGPAGALLPNSVQFDKLLNLALQIRNESVFDPFGQLQHLRTTVDIFDIQEFIQVQGNLLPDGKLNLVVRLKDQGNLTDFPKSVIRRSIDLPAGGLVVDSLAPQPKLKNLRVGQQWTFQSYRPFPPNSSLQMVEAKVEGRQTIQWNGKPVQVFKVSYRNDAGSSLTASREPFGYLWVRSDGVVVKQQVRFASLNVAFIRISDRENVEAES